MKAQWEAYTSILKNLVKPALGCTEPISAAYAAAIARRTLGAVPDSLTVFVSNNLYKNAKGVFVPGTGKTGLAIAAATGCIAGDPDADLQVLSKLTPENVKQAQALIDANRVKIVCQDTDEYIYCRLEAKQANNECEIIISGGHTQIIQISLNQNCLFKLDEGAKSQASSSYKDVKMSIQRIYDFAINAPFEEIKFILQAANLNKALALEGLNNPYGLEIGRALAQNIEDGFLSADLMTRIQMHTSAASDARMGGAVLPAMSNFGSGNQGIAATVPVCVAAEYFNADEVSLARALIMSHLGAIYIKTHYPPLSAFCGNTVTSAAAAMAIVYLSKGSFEQSCHAIQNVLSDSAGMVCDGAKSSCAMKICTSSSAAVRAFMLAKRNCSVANQGIIGKDVEASIRNVGQMITKGMQQTDSTIIALMKAS